MQLNAFARSKQLFALIAASLAANPMADISVFHYTSRGHGLGRRSGKSPGNRSGIIYPVQGEQASARRRRQIAHGILRAENGLCLDA